MRNSRSKDLSSRAAAPDVWRQPIRPRSLVLLAGAVGANSLPLLVGRSVLDLPLETSLRLSDVWSLRIARFLGDAELNASVEVLLLVGESSPMPALPEHAGGPRFRVERDSSGFRGTAGALRDLCAGFRDEDHVLVGNASQCPDEGLLDQLVAEADPTDGVTLSVGLDGAPTGLMLVRSDALRQIPSVGYIDLKEQALPRIAQQFGARAIVSATAASPPIRGLRTYLPAVRSWHRCRSLRGTGAVSPFEERWAPAFGVIEQGAQVASTAKLYDSVVLSGGVVEHGAEVVRSVIGPSGVVSRGSRVLDQLVTGSAGASAAGPHGPGRSAP